MGSEHLIIFITFLCVFVFVLWCFPSDRTDMRDKLPLGFSIMMPMAELFSQDLGIWMERLFPVLSDKILEKCKQANLSWRAATMYGMMMTLLLATFIFLGILAFAFGLPGNMVVVICAVVGVCDLFYPFVYVKHRAENRMLEISRNLPFAIDMICSSMEAGADFLSAIRYYTTLEFTDTFSRELLVFLREVELGKSRSDALRHMALRLHSFEVDRFVSSIVFGLESGTAITAVMQMQADEVRRMRFASIEQQIAKVPSKMIVPIMVCIVPAMFIIVLVPLFLNMANSGLIQAWSQFKL